MHAALCEQSLIGSVAYSVGCWGDDTNVSLVAEYGVAALTFIFETVVKFVALVVYF